MGKDGMLKVVKFAILQTFRVSNVLIEVRKSNEETVNIEEAGLGMVESLVRGRPVYFRSFFFNDYACLS